MAEQDINTNNNNGYDTITFMESGPQEESQIEPQGSFIRQDSIVLQTILSPFIMRMEKIEDYLLKVMGFDLTLDDSNYGNTQQAKPDFPMPTFQVGNQERFSKLQEQIEKIFEKEQKSKSKIKKIHDMLSRVSEGLEKEGENWRGEIARVEDYAKSIDREADISFLHEKINSLKENMIQQESKLLKSSQNLFDQLDKRQKTTSSQLATLILQFKELPPHIFTNQSSAIANQSSTSTLGGTILGQTSQDNLSNNLVAMTLYQDLQQLKVTMEGLKKPLVSEMNNLRKENENINREINRMMGQIRDGAAQTLHMQKQINQQNSTIQELMVGGFLPSQSPRATQQSIGKGQFMSTQHSPGRTLFPHGNLNKSTLSNKKTTIGGSEPMRVSFDHGQILSPLNHLHKGTGIVSASVDLNSKGDTRNTNISHNAKAVLDSTGSGQKVSQLALLQSLGSGANSTMMSLREKNRSIDFNIQNKFDSNKIPLSPFPHQAPNFKGIINSTARANGAGFMMPLERFERILAKNDTQTSYGFQLTHSPSTRRKL